MFPTFRNWYRSVTAVPTDINEAAYGTIQRIVRPLGRLLWISASIFLSAVLLYAAIGIVFVVGSGDGGPKSTPLIFGVLEWLIAIAWWVSLAAFVAWIVLQVILLVRFRPLLTKGERVRAAIATWLAAIIVIVTVFAAVIALLLWVHGMTVTY